MWQLTGVLPLPSSWGLFNISVPTCFSYLRFLVLSMLSHLTCCFMIRFSSKVGTHYFRFLSQHFCSNLQCGYYGKIGNSSSLDFSPKSPHEPWLPPLSREFFSPLPVLSQSLQIRSSLLGSMFSMMARPLEHPLHTTNPHFLQWCRRLVVVNVTKHRMHLWVAWSGIQDLAKVHFLSSCSRLLWVSLMCDIQAFFSS